MTQHNFFAYGTLMCEEIFLRVVGRELPSEPAYLRDYARYAVRGESYPAIVAETGGVVTGLLYREVDDALLQTLDVYEGNEYTRRTLAIETLSADRLLASTYVIAADQHHRLSRRPWNFDAFCRDHKAHYLRGL